MKQTPYPSSKLSKTKGTKSPTVTQDLASRDNRAANTNADTTGVSPSAPRGSKPGKARTPLPLQPGETTDLRRHGTRGSYYLVISPSRRQVDCGTTDHATAKRFETRFNAGQKTGDPLKLRIRDILLNPEPGTKPMKEWRRDLLLKGFGHLKVADVLVEEPLKAFAKSRRKKNGGELKEGSVRLDLAELGRFINGAGRKLDPAFTYKLPWLPKKSTPRSRWLRRTEAARLLLALRGRIWNPTAGNWRLDPKKGRIWDPTLGDWLRDPATGKLVMREAFTIARRQPLIRFVLFGLYTASRSDVMLTCHWRAGGEHGHIDLEHALFYRLGPNDRRLEEARYPKRSPTAKIVPKLMMYMVGTDGEHGWRRADRDSDAGLGLIIRDENGSTPHQFWTRWLRALKDAGLDRTVVRHTLRHTAITWYLERRASPKAVAELAGLDERPMLRSYAQVDAAFTDSVADAIDRAVRAEPVTRRAAMAAAQEAAAKKREAKIQHSRGPRVGRKPEKER